MELAQDDDRIGSGPEEHGERPGYDRSARARLGRRLLHGPDATDFRSGRGGKQRLCGASSVGVVPRRRFVRTRGRPPVRETGLWKGVLVLLALGCLGGLGGLSQVDRRHIGHEHHRLDLAAEAELLLITLTLGVDDDDLAGLEGPEQDLL